MLVPNEDLKVNHNAIDRDEAGADLTNYKGRDRAPKHPRDHEKGTFGRYNISSSAYFRATSSHIMSSRRSLADEIAITSIFDIY